jgi:Fe(3+) dicitrate transport protein
MKIKFILLSLIAQVHIFGQKNNTIDSIATNKLNEISIISTNPHKSIGAGVYLNPIKLEKLNQNDINKVLLSVPGVNVRDEEGFGLRPNIGLRGTAVNRSAKITLMEDGILMAPAPYADPSAYYFPTFARMEGIEVLKGSSQIKYGPYTIGGVINLISISIPESFKGFAQISYGSFGTNQQRIWIGNNTKNIDYVFELNRIASNGFKTLDNGNNTGFDRRDMMAKIRWHNNNLKIPQFATLKVLNTTELGNETYLGLTYEDFKTNPYKRYAATQKDKLDLNHHHISINHNINPIKNLNIISTVYYAKTFRDWGRINTIKGLSVSNILANPISNDTAYNIMNGKESGDMTYQNAARTYHSKGIQTNISYKLNSNQFHHNFQIGLRYHKDEADRYATQSSYNMINGIMIKTQMGINGNKENQIREANSFFNLCPI